MLGPIVVACFAAALGRVENVQAQGPAPTDSSTPQPSASASPSVFPPPAPVAVPAVAPMAVASAIPPSSAPMRARVFVKSDWQNGWLEQRSFLGNEPWVLTCQLPCDKDLEVEGTEARVAAPGMTTSNAFRIDPGSGVARLSVAGGDATLRRWGMVSLIGGLAIGLGGAALYGYGRVERRDSLVTLGVVTLSVAGVAVIGSLPLLSAGATTVRDGRGRTIAGREPKLRF
jgi:hypothetical protein